MQRIPIFAGVITIDQLKALAILARRYTPGTPLHITTRQNIEFHNVRESDQMLLHSEIASLGFDTFGAGGDSVRNITICPCCKYDEKAWDPQPLAESVKKVLDESGLLFDMPRKFKLAFSGCARPETKPYATDFAVMLTSPTQATIIGAGSLGPSPELGIILYQNFPVGQIPALALAALQLFVEIGDRENRRKARLRHIRQRLGDDIFRAKLAEYFDLALTRIGTRSIDIEPGSSDYNLINRFQPIAGDIEPQLLLLLCETAEKAGAILKINLRQGIDIYAKNIFELPQELQQYIGQPNIIACPGSTTCKNGIVNAPELARELAQKLRDNKIIAGKIIAISGCPNNCMHSCVADIGLVGRIKTIDGTKQEAYTLLIDGDNASTPKLAQKIDVLQTKNIAKKIKNLYI